MSKLLMVLSTFLFAGLWAFKIFEWPGHERMSYIGLTIVTIFFVLVSINYHRSQKKKTEIGCVAGCGCGCHKEVADCICTCHHKKET